MPKLRLPGTRASGAGRLAAAAVLLVSAIVSAEQLPEMSTCWFHNVTQLPCPGCGMTHAFCSISHGELGAAWSYNPFAYVFYAGAVVVLLPRPQRGRQLLLKEPLTRIGIASLMMALWIFGAWRMLS